MADVSREKEVAPEAAQAKKKGLRSRLNLRNWAVIVIAASVFAHVIMLALYPVLFKRGEVVSGEVDLGQYAFTGNGQPSELERAEFSLYVNLLTEIDGIARGRIQQKKFRIRQDVEELLRQSHASDFEDPTLTELKRQLQEKINDALEMRAIESVIVTKLTLFRTEQPSSAGQASATKPATPRAHRTATPPGDTTDQVGKSADPPDTLPEAPVSKQG